MKTKVLLILLIVAIFGIHRADAQNLYRTPYSLSGGIFVNGNMHNSQFKELGTMQNCCTEFKDALGIGWGFSLGAGYKFKSKILGVGLRYNLQLAYNDISANYLESQRIGYFVRDNSFEPIMVDYSVNPSISLFMLEHYIDFLPSFTPDLKIKGGMQIGLPIIKSFSQKEMAVTPSDFNFENGTRTRSEYEGEILDFNPVHFALATGLEYRVYQTRFWEMYADLQWNVGLTSLVENNKIIDANSLRLGTKLYYQIPGDLVEPISPPYPKMSEPLEPPAPKFVSLKLNADANGYQYKNGDTIDMPLEFELFQERYSFLPILFYEANSTEYIASEFGDRAGVEKNAQLGLINSVVEYLQKNPNLDVTLVAYGNDSENTETIDKRIELVKKTLIERMIAENRIKSNKVIKSTSSFRYNELKEENQKLEFEFSNRQKLVEYFYQNREEIGFPTQNINFSADINTNDEKLMKYGEIFWNNQSQKEFNNDKITYTIDESFSSKFADLKVQQLQLYFLAKTQDGKRADATFVLNFSPRIVANKFFSNVVKDNNSGESYEQYILGYTDFDESRIHSVDNKVIQTIQNAVAEGKSVSLLALTDNIGSLEYNQKLAESRANSALKILGKLADKISIEYPSTPVFSNNHPYGRILNRSIIVRIMNKKD